jgi:hypothetical protein
VKPLAVRSALVVPWLAAALGAAVGGWAQAPASTAPAASAPAAAGPAWPDEARYAADVTTPDTTIAALYDVISGPAGPRDWDRFRNLFAPGARLVPAAPRKDGSAPPSFSPEDYVQRASGSFAKNGFFEREVARVAERYGTILHAFSTYESRHAREDAAPFARGVNSIQLLQHAGRWWIVTVMWDQERADNPLPARYAPGGR